ncbi:phage tail protein [Kordiimonas sp.]|uniref:phage tail protein n=1 Tax=Kordiimonas sp. TaxID=1970157 RepID=UPI003A8F31F6
MNMLNNNHGCLRRATKMAFFTAGMATILSGAAFADCGVDGTTGQICMMAGTYCPVGTVDAAGGTLKIADYPLLYSVIGISYGGDGRIGFQVPDLRGRVPVGVGTGYGLGPVELGQQRGAELADVQQAGDVAAATSGDKIAVAQPGNVNVVSPQLGIRYCIVTNGNFPQRSE